MINRLPILFIGSSSESFNYLSKIEEILEGTVKVNSWKKVFDPQLSNYLNDIINGITKSTCALFIFAADDKRERRGNKEKIPRDNVIFETGIAIGLLGRERVFIIAEQNVVLPTDLEGLTVFKIYAGKDCYKTSLESETNKLKTKLISLKGQLDKSPIFLNEYILEDIRTGVLNAKTIYAISPMLASFLDNHEVDIRNRLADNTLEKFIAVVRDPDGNTLSLISTHNNSNSEPKSVHKKISASIATLQKLKHNFPDKVEIRVIDHPFMCSSYIFDPETTDCKICVQYNPFGDVDRLPQLFIPSNRPFWNDFYLKQGNEYINKSKPYPAVYSTILLDNKCDFAEKNSLLNLWNEGYKSIGTGYRGNESALNKLKKGTLLCLAKDNEKLIGFSVIDTMTGKRKATVIEKKYRKKGIATDLIRISLNIVSNQFSEVHLYSKDMQIVFAKNGFKSVSSEQEINSILERQDIKFEYDKKSDVLKYKKQNNNNEWFILYKK